MQQETLRELEDELVVRTPSDRRIEIGSVIHLGNGEWPPLNVTPKSIVTIDTPLRNSSRSMFGTTAFRDETIWDDLA